MINNENPKKDIIKNNIEDKKDYQHGYLHDWLFHYNCYDEYYYGFRREHQKDYFNGTSKNWIRSKEIKTLFLAIKEQTKKGE